MCDHAEDGHKNGCTSVPMFDIWYYGRRIGATDAPTIYDERGHEHRALIRRLHHSAPDHEPPRWCGCPRRPLRARRPLWGSTMAASSASSGVTGAASPVCAAAASSAARKAAEGLESGQSAAQALRPLSHCAPPTHAPTEPWSGSEIRYSTSSAQWADREISGWARSGGSH